LVEPIQTEEKAIAVIIATYNNKGYNLLSKAKTFSFLYNLYGSVKEVHRVTQIDTTSISRYLRISNLPNEVKELISSGKIQSYHLAAELARITNEVRLIETAKAVSGIPREIGREIIRYVFKNQDKEVGECAQTILELYDKDINLRAFVFNKKEFINSKLIKNGELINKIKNNIYVKYSFIENIHLSIHGNNVLFVADTSNLDILKNKFYPLRSMKKIIKKVILDAI